MDTREHFFSFFNKLHFTLINFDTKKLLRNLFDLFNSRMHIERMMFQISITPDYMELTLLVIVVFVINSSCCKQRDNRERA